MIFTSGSSILTLGVLGALCGKIGFNFVLLRAFVVKWNEPAAKAASNGSNEA
jgi:hypothetical protein